MPLPGVSWRLRGSTLTSRPRPTTLGPAVLADRGDLSTSFVIESLLSHDAAVRRRREDSFAFRTFTGAMLDQLSGMVGAASRPDRRDLGWGPSASVASQLLVWSSTLALAALYLTDSMSLSALASLL